MDKNAFGVRLDHLMRKQGLHQAALARAAGISRNSVCTYINGRSYPGHDALAKLAGVFAMSVEELLPGHESLGIRGAVPRRQDVVVLRIGPRKVPLDVAEQIFALLRSVDQSGPNPLRGVFG